MLFFEFAADINSISTLPLETVFEYLRGRDMVKSNDLFGSLSCVDIRPSSVFVASGVDTGNDMFVIGRDHFCKVKSRLVFGKLRMQHASDTKLFLHFNRLIKDAHMANLHKMVKAKQTHTGTGILFTDYLEF